MVYSIGLKTFSGKENKLVFPGIVYLWELSYHKKQLSPNIVQTWQLESTTEYNQLTQNTVYT